MWTAVFRWLNKTVYIYILKINGKYWKLQIIRWTNIIPFTESAVISGLKGPSFNCTLDSTFTVSVVSAVDGQSF